MFPLKKFILMLSVGLPLFIPIVTSAQGPKLLEPAVVTATRGETPQEQLGSSVTVVTEDDVQTYHYQSVDEALRNVPGVDIQRTGAGPGKLTTIRIRGAGPAQVQVMIDGVRVKSPTSGDFNFSDISADQIDRIEVVRGPQATLYGADAIGGVVNIITKRGKGKPSATLSVEGGNYNTFRERISINGGVKVFDYSVGASRLDSGGRFENDDAGQTALSGQVGVALPLNGRLALIARYTKSETDLPIKSFPLGVLDPNAQQQTELTVLTLQWDQKFVPWWEQHLALSKVWNNLGFQDPPDPPATGAGTVSQINTTRNEAEWVNRFHIQKIDTVTVGVEWREEKGKDRGTFDELIITRALFFQNELRLFERLFLTGGIRFDDNSVFGSETTYRGALAFLIKETGTKLKASYGTGFRAPTLNDLFFPGFGNPNLRPESSEGWDAGFEQKLWNNRVRFGATYFRNRFENRIQTVCTPDFSSCSPENVGRALTEGMEAELAVEPIDALLLNVNYTLLRTEDLDTNLSLRRFPRNRWNIGVSYDPIKRLNLFTQIYIVGSQFESSTVGRNPGYERVDVGGTYRLLDQFGALKNLELTARVQNLFNRSASEVFGFPALGVNYLFGVRGTFN